MNDQLSDLLFKLSNSYCKRAEESGVCIYEPASGRCRLKEHCYNMPADRWDEFPESLIDNITEKIKSSSLTKMLIFICLFISLFILLLCLFYKVSSM